LAFDVAELPETRTEPGQKILEPAARAGANNANYRH